MTILLVLEGKNAKRFDGRRLTHEFEVETSFDEDKVREIRDRPDETGEPEAA